LAAPGSGSEQIAEAFTLLRALIDRRQ
jgi:hypothetical protein